MVSRSVNLCPDFLTVAAMANVEQMIDDILRREGGFVDQPADRGGPARYGVTQQTLGAYLGRDVSRDDVVKLEKSLARQIYRDCFYIGPRIDELPQAVQPFMFDCAIIHGPRRAIKFLQAVCNQAGCTPALIVDGAMGPKSRKAVSWTVGILGDRLLRHLIEERKWFYRAIVENDPSQEVFLAGWMNRVGEFEGETA